MILGKQTIAKFDKEVINTIDSITKKKEGESIISVYMPHTAWLGI